jgi:hypothetical protein
MWPWSCDFQQPACSATSEELLILLVSVCLLSYQSDVGKAGTASRLLHPAPHLHLLRRLDTLTTAVASPFFALPPPTLQPSSFQLSLGPMSTSVPPCRFEQHQEGTSSAHQRRNTRVVSPRRHDPSALSFRRRREKEANESVPRFLPRTAPGHPPEWPYLDRVYTE